MKVATTDQLLQKHFTHAEALDRRVEVAVARHET